MLVRAAHGIAVGRRGLRRCWGAGSAWVSVEVVVVRRGSGSAGIGAWLRLCQRLWRRF